MRNRKLRWDVSFRIDRAHVFGTGIALQDDNSADDLTIELGQLVGGDPKLACERPPAICTG
jgi:hypothetical protein